MIFPPFEYKVRLFRGERQIFDIIRAKYVVITPEEWVRQHLIHYLVDSLKYPKGLIAVERLVNVNGVSRRYDLACFNNDGSVYLLVECKKEQITLNQQVFDQVFCYNTQLHAEYVAITNGHQLLCGKITENGVVMVAKLPQYQ